MLISFLPAMARGRCSHLRTAVIRYSQRPRCRHLRCQRSDIAIMITASGHCLLIAPQGLGDSLEATPMITALRRGGASVDVAVLRPGPRELFEALPGVVDRVIYLPYWESGLTAFLTALLRTTRRARYEASFLAFPASRPEYQLLARAFGASIRVAHAYWRPTATNLLGLNTHLVPMATKHNILRNLDLLSAVGIEGYPTGGYVVPDGWRLGRREAGLLAFHVGTVRHDGLDAKRWPAARFAELAQRMSGRGFSVHFIAGPDERMLTRNLARSVPGSSVFEGGLPDVARFLSSAAAAITNDSGIGHLAAAVGTPVLALHGPTPVEGGPYGANAFRLRPSPCAPCFDPRRRNTRCALGIDYACLKRDMTVDIVENHLSDLLGAQRGPTVGDHNRVVASGVGDTARRYR